MDENYQTYLNRVARLTLPATYESQAQHLQESPKFKPDSSGERQAVPFPGYTVITPPWQEEESENASFYGKIKACQEQLLEQLAPGLMVPVPPDSFHLTLADLLWDSAYYHAIKNPDFEEQLRSQIDKIFSNSQPSIPNGRPICWQALGLMVLPRALAVCLVPKNEESYERILKFRRSIYQNPGLVALGIEQQYGFTAHITLGYLGDVPPDLDREQFSKTLSQINQQWLETEPPEFCSSKAELRKFDNMTRYYRQADWPVLKL